MFVYELSGRGFDPSCNHLNSDFMPASSKEFLDIHATIECGFTLKRILDMTRTYSQLFLFHCSGKLLCLYKILTHCYGVFKHLVMTLYFSMSYKYNF